MKSSLFAFALFASSVLAQQPRSISGIYPSLAMFNNEGECGTGAVVPRQTGCGSSRMGRICPSAPATSWTKSRPS